MELFDRRFASWRSYSRALEDYLAAIDNGRSSDGVLNAEVTPEGLAFLLAESDTRYLFGSDFREKIHEMSEHVLALQEMGPGGSMYRQMRKHVFRIRWDLENLAERYMMLGHIGVARPAVRLPTRVRRLIRRLRPPRF